MILQILADRQIGNDIDAGLAQMLRRPDPRQHQQLRRVERTAGNDHFAVGRDADGIVAVEVFDAGRASCPASGCGARARR